MADGTYSKWFEVSYKDPETGETVNEVKQFSGDENCTPKFWAEDYAYARADKGWNRVRELSAKELARHQPVEDVKMPEEQSPPEPGPASPYVLAEEVNRQHRNAQMRAPNAADAIDALVSQWHAGASNGESLQKYLGLTWAQYDVWLKTAELPAGYVPPSFTGPLPQKMRLVALLEGRELDYWAAHASRRWDEGWLERHRHTESLPRLSTDFGEGGPLLGEFGIDFDYDHDVQLAGGNGYCAMVYDYNQPIKGYRGHFALLAKGFGRDHLVAACRALVTSVYGPAVPI